VLNGKGQIIQFEGKTDIINRLSGSMNDSLDTKNQLPDELRNQVAQLLTIQRH